MSGKTRKAFRLTEETLQIIEETKKERGLSTDTETVEHIVHDYYRKTKQSICQEDKECLVEMLMDGIRGEFGGKINHMLLASVGAERNTFYVLDAVNTMLYDSNAGFLMPASEETLHKALQESKERYKAILEHRKQIKDSKAKGGK